MSDDTLNEIKYPYETDRRGRYWYATTWTLICAVLCIFNIFVYFYIGFLGLVFTGLSLLALLIGAGTLLEHDPFPRSITAVSDIPIAAWGNLNSYTPGKGKSVILCENNLCWGKRLWMSGKPWRIRPFKQAVKDLISSIESGAKRLATATEKLKKDKVDLPKETREKLNEITATLEKLPNTALMTINGSKADQQATDKWVEDISEKLHVYHDVIKLPDNRWHPFYMLGQNDYRSRNEVIAQVKAGQTVRLDGSYHLFNGSEFDAEIFKGKLPNPAVWFVPRNLLPLAEADAEESPDYGKLIVNINQRVYFQSKIIEGLELLITAKDLSFEYLRNVMKLSKSQIKAVAHEAGKTEKEALEELRRLREKAKGAHNVVKNFINWAKQSMLFKALIGLAILAVVGHYVFHFP